MNVRMNKLIIIYCQKYFLSAIAEPYQPTFCRKKAKPGPLCHRSNILTSPLMDVCKAITHCWKALTPRNSKQVFVFKNDVICVSN